MRFILLLLLFTSSAHANFVPRMSDLNFYRYAQPQLKNLTSEFYLVLKKLNSNHTDFIVIQKSINQHIHQLHQCKDLKYCAAIDRVAKDLNRYEQLLWKTQDNLSKLQVDSAKISYDNILKTIELARSMQDKISKLKTEMEIYLAINKNSNDAGLKHIISQNLTLILLQAQEGATALIDKSYQQDFRSINDNFITSIEKYILLNNDKTYLLGRYRELDNSWNAFNLKLEREVQNFPKEYLNLVVIMHNRWNSVLKIILRR